jgi:hypothetical protein
MQAHAQNAALPIVTITGLQFGTLLGGAVVTETVFAWPGIGRLAIQSIYNRDYPVVQCTVFSPRRSFIVINFAIDAALWRPRSRASAPAERRAAVARRPARRRASGATRGSPRRRCFVVAAGLMALAAPWLAPHDPARSRCGRGWRARRWRRPDGSAPPRHRPPRPRRALAHDLRRARLADGRLRGGRSAASSARRSASLAGFRGGWTDTVIMTVADAQLAFPFILLAIGIIAVLGRAFPR